MWICACVKQPLTKTESSLRVLRQATEESARLALISQLSGEEVQVLTDLVLV